MAPRRSERQTPEQAAESIRLNKEKRDRALGSAFVPPRTCYLPTTSTRPVVPSIPSFHSPILPPFVPSFLPSLLPFMPSSLYHFLLSLQPPLLRPCLLTPSCRSFLSSFLPFVPSMLPSCPCSVTPMPSRSHARTFASMPSATFPLPPSFLLFNPLHFPQRHSGDEGPPGRGSGLTKTADASGHVRNCGISGPSPTGVQA